MATNSLDHRNWTTPGAQDAAQKTYASVKAALAASSELTEYDIEIFLQGSYANHTNTRGDSDVDIVVMMTTTFRPDTSQLAAYEVENHRVQRVPGTHSTFGLREAVGRALRAYYGSGRVESRNKCFRVAKTEGYVDADVVPAMQYRRFTSFPSRGYGSPEYIEGIVIVPLEGADILNYPKEHIKNGNAKNARAGKYKDTVRQVKRLRRAATDAGLLQRGIAPGYVLECMVFNAPDYIFAGTDSQRLIDVMAWLHNHNAEELAATMWSGDRIHHLFQDDPGQHNQYTFKRVIDTMWDFL